MRHADIYDLEGHEEMRVVHPKGAIIHAATPKHGGQSIGPFSRPVAPLPVPLTDAVGVAYTQKPHHAILAGTAITLWLAYESLVEDLSDIQNAIRMISTKTDLAELWVANRSAAHGEALVFERLKSLPKLLRVEAMLVEVN
jgi:hypothetical protein